MNVDFAETYRKLSTDDLEQLGREAADLRPEARLCLEEAELRSRSLAAKLEPVRVKPPFFADGDVVVQGSSLKFPHLCPFVPLRSTDEKGKDSEHSVCELSGDLREVPILRLCGAILRPVRSPHRPLSYF